MSASVRGLLLVVLYLAPAHRARLQMPAISLRLQTASKRPGRRMPRVLSAHLVSMYGDNITNVAISLTRLWSCRAVICAGMKLVRAPVCRKYRYRLQL